MLLGALFNEWVQKNKRVIETLIATKAYVIDKRLSASVLAKLGSHSSITRFIVHIKISWRVIYEEIN